jgi:hypothetical protein
MRIRMQRSRGLVALLAVTSVVAIAAWAVPASAAPRYSTLKIVTGTVSCTTSQGALQISAIAYRPSLGYAAALIETGPANTPATIVLVGAQTNKSDYTLDNSCSRTKKSVRFTRRGLAAQGVVKAGYNQSDTVYCGAPSRVIIRYRIGFASTGKPATATIAVWAKRKNSTRLRETGFVQWSRSRSNSYYSKKACVSEF